VSPFVRRVYPAIDCGDLPVAKINTVLGTELMPGRAILSLKAHLHVACEHARDYDVCIQLLLLTLGDVRL